MQTVFQRQLAGRVAIRASHCVLYVSIILHRLNSAEPVLLLCFSSDAPKFGVISHDNDNYHYRNQIVTIVAEFSEAFPAWRLDRPVIWTINGSVLSKHSKKYVFTINTINKVIFRKINIMHAHSNFVIVFVTVLAL